MAFTTEEEAALRGIIAIFKGQAPSLSDDVAEKATGLFPQWDGAGKTYTTGERIAYDGDLYVCLQNHVSQVAFLLGRSRIQRTATTRALL